MDKKKLNEIVQKVVSYIENLPMGSELSTWQATKNSYGVDGLEDMDFFEIDRQLHKTAKKHGIELDCSKYEDCEVGLPFNIPFIVKKQSK